MQYVVQSVRECCMWCCCSLLLACVGFSHWMLCLLLAQAMGKSCISVYATPSSLYTQSFTAVWALNRQATAKLHARSAGLLLSISCRGHLLPHSAELHKHSSLVQALLPPPPGGSLSNMCCSDPIVASQPMAFMLKPFSACQMGAVQE